MQNARPDPVVLINGKTLRGSYNREDRASTIHMISAYASSNKLVLGQLKTEHKSNEIKAIPELIKMLNIKGALVTIDAMACQTKISKAIVDQGGDYLLAVKSNQGKLRQSIEKAFASERANMADSVSLETNHGRIESRQCYVADSAKLEGDFKRWKACNALLWLRITALLKGKRLI
ncbi:ISAs1 family transposase [Vibrio breoganii]|uniref:ISAs1 family transposase n=1 Tax=Vibrio breoganii TaxID=553239 RepID=UPI002410C201|nr:ISAs1 family transposase [Vibrio breoganii]